MKTEGERETQHNAPVRQSQRRAYIMLVFISCIFSVGGVGYSIHSSNAKDRVFCEIVYAATATPVFKPDDPATHPQGELNYEKYERMLRLKNNLGC